MRSVSRLGFVCSFFFVLVPLAFAQQPLDGPQPAPPAPPLTGYKLSERGAATLTEKPGIVRRDDVSSVPDEVMTLPLSAGLSTISIPFRAKSEKLSDLLTNLPAGSRAWTWDASAQTFVEGFDNTLRLGQAVWLYLPAQALVVVTGQRNTLSGIPVELRKGWNFIGVPYSARIKRSQQLVYVDRVKTAFNDAVKANAIGSTIWSFDKDGYAVIGEDGSFEPMGGYWVYSSGSQLLELVPYKGGLKGLQGVGDDWWGWALEKAGGGVISRGAGMGLSALLSQMGLSSDPQLAGKLDQISQDLARINHTLDQMNNKLDTVLASIDVTRDQILLAIGDAKYVAPMQGNLKTYYDDPTPNLSLKWFADQALQGNVAEVTISNGGNGYTTAPTVTFQAAPTGGTTATGTAIISGGTVTGVTITNGGSHYASSPAVTFTGGGGTGAAGSATLGATMAAKTKFANKVTDTFIGNFNDINIGISRANADGLLDHFADNVVLTSTPYDLKDRYLALQSYFNTLIGLQLKAGILIMNAYNQLGADPSTSGSYPAPQTAANWKRDVFDPAIRQEIDRFQIAVDNIVLSKIQLARGWREPAAIVPDWAQNILGMSDFFVMQTLKGIYPNDDRSKAGLHVHLFVNPGLANDVKNITYLSFKPGQVLDVRKITDPAGWQRLSLTSNQWMSVKRGPQYDNWTIPIADRIAEFTVTNEWKTTRVTIPDAEARGYFMTPGGDAPWWRNNPKFPGVAGAALVDDTGVASPTGTTVFGSMVIVRRPFAPEIMQPCTAEYIDLEAPDTCPGDNVTNPKQTGNFRAPTPNFNPCDTLSIDAIKCSAKSRAYVMYFKYVGTNPSPMGRVDFQMDDGEGPCASPPKGGGATYTLEFADATNGYNIITGAVNDNLQHTLSFTKGDTYGFKATLTRLSQGRCSDYPMLRYIQIFLQF